MPWTIADVDRHKHGLSAKQKRQWMHVANGALSRCMEQGNRSESSCAASAIRQANSAVGEPELSTDMQAITVQLATQQSRRATLDGREYLVARAVPILESVLNDYFIPREEIAAFVESWNGIPLPIGHPQNQYGDYVSANSPEMLEQSVGRFFHAQMDGAKLIGEVWIDVEKCQRLGGDAAEIVRLIEANETLEISTAFWPETEQSPGVYNGQSYQGIHRHLRPDHLALLPNGVGACSAAMGCGVRTHAGACQCGGMAVTTQQGKIRSALQTLFAFAHAKEAEKESEDPLLSTHLTHDDLRMALYAELSRGRNQMYGPDIILDITTDGYVVYRDGERFFRRAYTAGDGNAVTLTGEAEEVQRDTRYIPVTTQTQQEKEMEKNEKSPETPPPVILEAIQGLLTTEMAKIGELINTKIAAHQESQERQQLAAFLATQGWKEEDYKEMPLLALRKLCGTLAPVTYAGQGFPRFATHAQEDEDLPSDSPAGWEDK